MRILEIGPGTSDGRSVVFQGADTVDGFVGNPTFVAEWGAGPLPIADSQYDLVFASHVLEHVPWYRCVAALREALRVLKPGGELEVYVPDFAYIVQQYLNRSCGDNWRVFNKEGHWMTWVNGRLFTYGPDAIELLSPERPIPQTHHKAVFDTEHLARQMREAGFLDIRALARRINGTAHSIREVGCLGRKQE